ncbi:MULTISPECIES: pyruvate carboxylase [Enterococcus]|uniref:Pyruvate carboxylase n=1 Tax=Enterococcus malodoratus ATCC 43197 TaxID=1158601 RepID=R2PHW0_9ENTE|nr:MULTISPECIES: pyruvate carboxylase [Enterococcus]EOH82808.1 pyruvate carboxylase [Enterococcus malodoratus ATCC 43197]EOT70624.1 pyruvate carboxylase [Enterococcus malodoratus ATCC 43197]OJG57793.1 pyruvate carboxylase [Enterococcus malodoratus]SPW86629.1 pyruvate carboxylase [Enterococcus malodoratus]STC71966.1 pyruvate carboxylase [Enterococcus malodoratus]
MKKVLVANRGEIATRVFRACSELNIKTVAIFAEEDQYSVHRFKSDEAYLVGKGKKPIDAYLDIEDIIRVAKEAKVDAIHPGYGFLSENLEFAKRCREEGLIFVGPELHHLDIFGDKIKAKTAALEAGIPSIPGSDGPVDTIEGVLEFAESHGYPVMIKAALGGGGRGMRVAHDEKEAREGYDRAKSEAKAAFGNDEIYVEKYVANPKHIEVQILGDTHGNVLHLFERDCSVQRRHQKVVEVAPCISLNTEQREKICQAAVQLMKHVGYVNAGTVEFLVEGDNFYFIEVNPRVQVEHTITELITGVDIVTSQLMIAQGKDLHKEIGLPKQEDVQISGAAIQCRVTTEDPLNGFMPDTGKIDTYRSPGGFGVRLDVGNAYAGATVTPYFDSLLVKVCTHAMNFDQAIEKMQRCLIEFRIRGVKTNIPFMHNVISHPVFQSGDAKTTFIDNTPELFEFPRVRDRGNKTMRYISEITVNGFPGIEKQEKRYFETPRTPKVEKRELLTAKNILDQEGPEAVTKWVKEQDSVLLTDTTFRDAHQSLLATRVRTHDLVNVAQATGEGIPELFSSEMWGGATFDVAYRFLTEDPWKRLKLLRKAMPNTLLQMLFRGSNAVGYSNYPDNVLEEFIKEASHNGIDVFRIFDSLNWIPQMEKSIQYVRDAGKIAEGTICYTGDILDPDRTKYNVQYYKDMAKELEAIGAHMIAIKDMAGLLKPQAAFRLISELKETTDLPIHLHTHDTAGNGIITLSAAVKAGVDVVDVATSAMSGATSQPSMSSLYYALQYGERTPELNLKNVRKLNHYWEDVRPYYASFENGIMAAQTEVYNHEMPGGQYSNLQQQAKAVGLGEKWDEIKEMYQTVNLMFGDIVKVTPSSKVVGDMALFMVQNDLTEQDIYDRGDELSYPDSVVSFFQGELGQPVGGFPEKLQQIILQGRPAMQERPGKFAEPVNFDKVKQELQEMIGFEPSKTDVLSYLMYPQVFLDYQKSYGLFADVTLLDTPTFFAGMRLGETITVQIEKGKTLIIRLDEIGEADVEGNRTLFFNLNGQRREILVKDASIKSAVQTKRKVEPTNREQIGATMTGSVLKVLVKKGDHVEKGQPLLITEAMKMETSIDARFAGEVSHLYVEEGESISSGDLLIEVKEK